MTDDELGDVILRRNRRLKARKFLVKEILANALSAAEWYEDMEIDKQFLDIERLESRRQFFTRGLRGES